CAPPRGLASGNDYRQPAQNPAAIGHRRIARLYWRPAPTSRGTCRMSRATTPLLEAHARFRSRDRRATQDYLDTRGFRLETMGRDAGDLDVRINGCFLPGLYIGYTQYGAPLTVGATAMCADYWLILPPSGPLAAP